MKRSKRFFTFVVVVAALLSAAAPADARQRQPKAQPTVDFAGYTWNVKDSPGLVGPGPNVFSKRNVRVDRKGNLHMRIRNRQGVWTSAEVILDQALGYGTYRFTIASPVDQLDPNAVLGLFTWDDDPAQANREIDIEFSRWGDPNRTTNANYVVQPYDRIGNTHNWTMPDATTSVHEMTWAPGEVSFTSSAGTTLEQWTYAGADVPDPGAAHARINLWLFRGSAPVDGKNIDIVISDFEFIPLQ